VRFSTLTLTLFYKEIKMCFADRLVKAAGAATTGGAAGAYIGGSVVSGVTAVGGSVVGPVGTFFGAVVGAGAGAAVGGAVGSVGGFVGSLVFDRD
jgi:hypothetical protein